MMVDHEIIPGITAIASDVDSVLHVVLRLQARALGVVQRPPLNLAIVLDRSGSMSGEKLERAQAAACRAVDCVVPGDRLAVVTFDDEVNVVVPSGPVAEPEAVKAAIRSIQPGGSTALAAGWEVGAREVSQNLSPLSLNRVLLLSDGQANVGLRHPGEIAQRVKHFEAMGVSTSALGVGDDYEESLMAAVALAGDGNFWHIDSAAELMAIFAAELQGLMATVGRKVSLRLDAARGVTVADCLNDFERLPNGGFKLPNLVVGKPQTILLKLAVTRGLSGGSLLNCRLAYDVPNTDARTVQRWGLELPFVAQAQLSEFPINHYVMEQVVLFEVARQRQQAIAHLRNGQHAAAREVLQNILQRLEALPQTGEVNKARDKALELLSDFQERRFESVIKKGFDSNIAQRRSR